MNASVPDTDPVLFDILLADGFVLTELAGVVDVLRLCNRISAREVFRWQYLSRAGQTVQSSSDAVVQSNVLSHRPEGAYLFVLGNADPDHPDLAVAGVVSAYKARQATVVLLAEAAGRHIADTSDMDTPHTTHWENRAVLAERIGLMDSRAALAVVEGNIITAAGMGATFDLTLSLAARHVSSATLMTVADILLHERIRHHNTLQPFSGRSTVTTGDRDLDACISLMQDHIEHPLAISQIADHASVSKRSLERKFNRILGITPNGYYREIRLSRANNLLLNTDMKIREIGLACGFPSGFTAVYRDTFGMTPQAARLQGLQTHQKRQS